jgi:superfamily I DNA and/or RNA helicase
MVPAIGNLISECFYGGTLTSGDRPPGAIAGALGRAVLWKTTSGNKDRHEVAAETSYVNPLEATVIRDTLRALHFIADHSETIRRSGQPVKAVVLTGYAAQRDLIKQMLDPHKLEWPSLTIEVSTVDAFQGKEADVAIYSVVRSNDAGKLGFLESRRRINVALSRGRDCLLIVGDDFFCRTARSANNPMRQVLEHIDRSSDCRVEPIAN